MAATDPSSAGPLDGIPRATCPFCGGGTAIVSNLATCGECGWMDAG